MINVIVRKGLLNHQQIELVQLRKMLGIRQAVVAVGIQHQQDIGETRAHSPRHFDIPTTFDLKFDSTITLVQSLCYSSHCGIKRGLYTDADANCRLPSGVMPGGRVAREAICQTHVIGFGKGIPNGGFQPGPRVVTTAEALN